jgi:hypothetical protein
MRAEVVSLISAHDEAGSQFLAEAALYVLEFGGSVSTTPSRRIGHYLLIEKVGLGGMGQVWLAEHPHPDVAKNRDVRMGHRLCRYLSVSCATGTPALAAEARFTDAGSVNDGLALGICSSIFHGWRSFVWSAKRTVSYFLRIALIRRVHALQRSLRLC